MKEKEDYILIEKEYWTGPGSEIRIMTGISWFLLGIIVSILFNIIF